MRSFRWVLLLFITAVPVHAEIHFLKGSLAEAIDKARTEQKPVMIDFITDWCRWCDTLDKNTYSDLKVATFINDNVVPIKIDAEKGEGIAIAKTYKVRGYPTILFITVDGNEIDRVLGYAPPEPFLATATDYMHGVGTIGTLRNQFEAKPDDPETVYALAHKYGERNDYEEAATYFTKLMALDPQNSLGYKEEGLFTTATASYRLKKDLSGLKGFVKEFPSSENTRGALRSIVTAALKDSDGTGAKTYLETYMFHWPDDAGMLNNYAWTASENGVNLEHAAEIAQMAVTMTPDSAQKAMYLDTYATVEFKRGNVAEAIRLEQRALDLMKDASPGSRKTYEETLAKFRSGGQVTQGK